MENWLESVKHIKKEKKLTNEALAQLSGISLGTLNKLLSGATSDPKLSTLTALSGALECSIDAMLGEQDEKRGIKYSYEEKLLERIKGLDDEGRRAVDFTVRREDARMKRAASESEARESRRCVQLKLFDLRVSAGPGTYLSDSGYSKINVVENAVTQNADFAVRVHGESMEPKYENGDILLVSESKRVERGMLGIFSVNGEAFFKKYGGDRLISLNPDYKDIVFGDSDDVVCFGAVLGRLKK